MTAPKMLFLLWLNKYVLFKLSKIKNLVQKMKGTKM